MQNRSIKHTMDDGNIISIHQPSILSTAFRYINFQQ